MRSECQFVRSTGRARVRYFPEPLPEMNLSTRYLGLTLKNPFIVGASPFCDHLDHARALEDAGAAAVVMRSLFEEQITAGRQPGSRSIEAEFAEFADYQLCPNEYLRQLERLKQVLSIPVIASLNGHHPNHWTDYARKLEDAGADAIELNFYQVITDPAIAADEVETEMLETMGLVTNSTSLPVAAKISPFHGSVAQLSVALELAGASGIVLFNRFYQPDVNTEDLEVHPILRLSEPSELLLRLRWLAILSPLVRAPLSVTGGVHSWSAVVKAILTGATTVQIVSHLLKHGVNALAGLREGLEAWMREHAYDSPDDFRGMLNLQRCRDTSAFERANYIRVLQSWKM